MFRIGKSEIEANPDGIHFSGVFFETLATFGQFSRKLALDRNTSAHQQGIAAELEKTESAMAYVWLSTANNSRVAQLDCGRDWLRVNLAATAEGVGIHPLSQALQEYPEMARYYRTVHDTLAPDGGTVQMLARLGYGKMTPPSPRWPLSEKIIRA